MGYYSGEDIHFDDDASSSSLDTKHIKCFRPTMQSRRGSLSDETRRALKKVGDTQTFSEINNKELCRIHPLNESDTIRNKLWT